MQKKNKASKEIGAMMAQKKFEEAEVLKKKVVKAPEESRSFL